MTGRPAEFIITATKKSLKQPLSVYSWQIRPLKNWPLKNLDLTVETSSRQLGPRFRSLLLFIYSLRVHLSVHNSQTGWIMQRCSTALLQKAIYSRHCVPVFLLSWSPIFFMEINTCLHNGFVTQVMEFKTHTAIWCGL